MWLATDTDEAAEEVLKAMEAMVAIERSDDEEVEMILPEWTGETVFRASAKLCFTTGLGVDWLRPRHIIHLSHDARTALAQLYQQIEKVARWPTMLRTTIEVALAKKAGGARLIGLTPALYRVWARARHIDCRCTVENRIRRPYLSAALGRGASKAVFDQAWDAEAAHSRDEVVASSIIDFKQYYEYIDAKEVIRGGRKVGRPSTIMLLSVHLYLGPRHISCGQAIAEALFPARSILAGCTWATLIIRIIMIGPTDYFINVASERFGGWQARLNMSIYVDDGIVSTRGTRSAVEVLHVWVSKMLLAWVSKILRKEIAQDKLFCITSSKGYVARCGNNLARRVSRCTRRAKFSASTTEQVAICIADQPKTREDVR